MMQYPLTIEQFQYPEFERGIGKEFITAFINAINNVYEKGRRVKNSGFCFTVGMVKGWYEKEYHSMCESEESNMLFDIYTEYANEAWRQGVRASHKPGGKLYTWELPGLLIDRVSAGDKAVVRTERGARTVIVTAVEEYAGNEPEPLRMVIRVKRAAQHGK